LSDLDQRRQIDAQRAFAHERRIHESCRQLAITDAYGTGALCAGFDARQADLLVERLQHWESTFGHRVDGELCLVDGGAVNWREYAGRSREVLVKRLDGAALELRDALFASTGVSA